MLFTFPSRYCFTIGRQIIFSLARRFSRIPTDSLRFRSTRVSYKDVLPLSPTWLSHSLARLSSRLRLEEPESTSGAPACSNAWSRNTRPATPPGFNTWPGLGSSQFARRYYGNRCYFLFLQVLRWFNSLSSLRCGYEFTTSEIFSRISGSPIQKSPDLCLLAAPRSLSQLATSFLSLWHLGIRPELFFSLLL